MLVIQLVLEPNGSKIPVELLLLLAAHLAGEHLLVEDGGLRLLPGLLDTSLHPMPVILRWFQIGVLELFLDVAPDLSILEIWVELDHFDHLLLLRSQLMEVETTPVEGAKDDGSDVE